MGRYARRRVGTIYVSKIPGQSDYLKFSLPPGETLEFRDGDKLQVESKSYRLTNAELGVKEGRIDAEFGAQLREKAEKMPDFVRAEVVLLSPKS